MTFTRFSKTTLLLGTCVALMACTGQDAETTKADKVADTNSSTTSAPASKAYL